MKSFGRKLIGQVSSWRSVRNPGSSTTGLVAGGSQIGRYFNRFVILPLIVYNISMAGAWLYLSKDANDLVRDMINEPDETLRKRMEEKGVNKEFCEAKIADIKQKIGSESTLQDERIMLRVYKRWMQEFTKDS